MGQHYILDGYNVIHAISKLMQALDVSAKEARRQLREHVHSYCNTGEITATIVYDSRTMPNMFDDYQDADQPHVVYVSNSSDADDFIIREAEKQANQNTTIVTRDNKVGQMASGAGCSVMTPREFFDFTEKRLGGRSGSRPRKYSDHKMSQDEIEQWKDLFKAEE
ncbi:MAG: NYN domain-containing protein [Candidatus Marinimicrobia bacterium]|nr:NYN domain-containing protein [Candidatus Neomarinimicrobiota bacterium]MCF7829174.1 NYN domain-containing protein [Candidatus Neomarinimicrobiota bacterium]MCF7881173.1 NYN domain-containing protein [Candidatus Neomarinimicrobiota bacterium]